jgi:hypothetical protein
MDGRTRITLKSYKKRVKSGFICLFEKQFDLLIYRLVLFFFYFHTLLKARMSCLSDFAPK